MKVIRTHTPNVCPICGAKRESGHCRHFVCIEGPFAGETTFNTKSLTCPEFFNMPVNDRVVITAKETAQDDVSFYWMDYEQLPPFVVGPAPAGLFKNMSAAIAGGADNER